MYINPHKIASNYPSPKVHSFTGNGARAGSSRRADEVRGFSETGFSYFGARYYDSDLSGLFLSVDPMADKYPSISPYAYCAWNPLKLVDPNGRKIWIVGDDGNTYQYKEGGLYTADNEKYDGDDAFVNKIGDCLTNMASTTEGGVVISQLEASEDNYTYKNIASSNPNAGGGFVGENREFRLKGADYGSIAHETFHAYQYDCGMRGLTDVREVGAYLFQAIMIKANETKEQWANCGMPISLFCGNSDYVVSMTNLFTNGFSEDDYKTAVNSFFTGSDYGRKYANLPSYKHATIPSEPPIKNLLSN